MLYSNIFGNVFHPGGQVANKVAAEKRHKNDQPESFLKSAPVSAEVEIPIVEQPRVSYIRRVIEKPIAFFTRLYGKISGI